MSRPLPSCALALLACGVLATALPAVETPVTPGVSAKAAALLSWLATKEGSAILSGQTEATENAQWAPASDAETPFARALSLTGKYPALRGFDFIWTSPEYTLFGTIPSQQRVAQRAIDWYNATNGVVQFQWHWEMLGANGHTGFYTPGADPTNGTDYDLTKAITSGTSENTRFLASIDGIAVELKKLRDAGVPVLWRPFHENSGGWFWWGAKGPEALKSAWKIMFNRLVVTNGLNNLIWVFNPGDEGALPSWYPGDEYVDIISLDKYDAKGGHSTFASSYVSAKAFAGTNKLVAMSENGALPDPAQLSPQGAKWAWFMTWSGEYATDPTWNSDSLVTSTYNSAYVLTRDELPDLKTLAVPTIGAASKLVFTRQPQNVYLGDSWPRPVCVAATDGSGQIVRGKTGTVTLQRNGSTLATAPLVNGVATFGSTVFTTAATGATLTASLSGLTSATSGAFNIGSASDPGTYTFEASTQGWTAGSIISSVAQSTDHVYAGARSLKLNFTGSAAGSQAVSVSAPPATAGSTVKFRVWLPAGTKVTSVQPFVQQGAAGNWTWTGGYVSVDQLTLGTWNTLTIAVPSNAVTPLASAGVVFATSAGWTGAGYLDTVEAAGSSDPAVYSFESGTQGWTGGGIISSVTASTEKPYAGANSLRLGFTGTAAGSQIVSVGSPSVAAGQTVTFRVWVPTGSQITGIQPYVQQGAGGGWTWTGTYLGIGQLSAGAWNTVTVTVPATAVTPLSSLGVQFNTGAAWTGTCYVDGVTW